jgi:superfamily II DNA or RNA helicase
MQTGKGKTETLLALFAAEEPNGLLVLVPSDALRTQIAGKFESFGVLQELRVVDPKSLRPIVGQIKHAFKSASEAGRFAQSCNVIVTTPAALYAATPDVRQTLFDSCSHLFVDEAHHVPAATWREIRDDFDGKAIVQFTATPFREDGRHLGGRVVYAFPLREAQKQSYFSHINFASVLDLGDHDHAVAKRAVDQLREDLEADLDHLVMARVSRIGRVEDVLPIYMTLAPDLRPVVLHSTTLARDRKAALQAIASRDSRIVICVNMLGEGFDLPSLKIAAIHDAHKSLGVTLQFVGRFARTVGSELGDATVIVGRPDRDFDRSLRRLYAEDADWNRIIRELSEEAVGEQQEISDFDAAFGSLPEEVAMRSLLPKMSTVVYRAPDASGWDPNGVLEVFPEEALLTVPIAINERDGVAWFVSENRTEVRWGELKTVEEVAYDLYVLYWDATRQLLYVNSSNNVSLHEGLAKAVAGPSAKRITGENVYRVMAHVQRLVPTNVGLLDVRNVSRRFSMLVGADVSEGFPVTEAQTKTKTNIFAYGYEDGSRVSIGASLKGRIWSFRVAATLKHWVDWCDFVGTKLIDDGISVDEVMQNFIRPKALEERPPYVPLAAEWPWQVFLNLSEELRAEYLGSSWPLVDVELRITTHDASEPIGISVTTPEWNLQYSLVFDRGEMQFSAMDADATVVSRSKSMSLADFLHSNGLLIYFEQDAVVVPPGMLLKPDRDIPPFDKNELVALDWSGVDLTVESQGPNRRQDSVQARTLEHVLSLADWEVVIDDDGTGEVADIVALRSDGKTLYIHLTHCKFVLGGKPRAQVADLYEVCGQAQKSAQWRRNVDAMFEYLLRRERRRVDRTGKSGFVKGNASALYALEDAARRLRPEFAIAVAQPGVSQAAVSAPQLELLAATETYVFEAAHSRLEVYSSP